MSEHHWDMAEQHIKNMKGGYENKLFIPTADHIMKEILYYGLQYEHANFHRQKDKADKLKKSMFSIADRYGLELRPFVKEYEKEPRSLVFSFHRKLANYIKAIDPVCETCGIKLPDNIFCPSCGVAPDESVEECDHENSYHRCQGCKGEECHMFCLKTGIYTCWDCGEIFQKLPNSEEGN